MSVQLRDNQQVSLSVTATDAAGQPTQAKALSFKLDDIGAAIATVTDNGDGTALLVCSGNLGTGLVIVSDDEDGDPATAEFLGTLGFEVVSGPVAAITVVAGTPEDKPVVAP